MTLIISCLTHDFAVQASDRRVTPIEGTDIEDRANKALFIGWNASFSYTGLATLDGLRTDEWICRRFKDSSPDLEIAWSSIRKLAENAVRSVPFPRRIPTADRDVVRRLALIHCGFARFSGGSHLTPFLTVISNFHNPPDGWSGVANRTFTVSTLRLTLNQQCQVFTAGAELSVRERATELRGVDLRGTIFHSDRGSQYLSARYRELCDRLGIRQSAGRVATCFDNSVAESFWSSLKRELVHRYRFATRAEAKAAITAWIRRYNNVRLHSTLGFVPPIEWELHYRLTQLEAA